MSDGPSTIGGHIARGAAWMVAMRWLMRAVGLINTVVLARLLSPDDFGVLAMSAVVVELLMMLGDTSVDIALIRDQQASREIYDSAWTVQAICGLVVAVFVVIAAHPLALYYHDARVELAVYILALRPAILGFENVGVAEFRKALDFAKEFRYWMFRRLSLLVFSLILAVTLRSYLALAIAAPISAVIAVIYSFVMSTYRPRLHFSHAALVWGASRWMILQNLAQTALDRSDEFIIGGVAPSAVVGNYYMASQVAPMPTRELAWPVERALMPAYAKIADQPDELRRTVLGVMATMALICFPAGIGILVTAKDFVATVFGPTWLSSVPFFQWLAIFGIFAGLGRPFMPLFYALGRERLYAALCVTQVAITIPVVIYAAYRLDLVSVAAGRTLVAGAFFAVFCAAAVRVTGLRIIDFAAALWRPLTASVLMAYSVLGLHNTAITLPILSLAHDIAVGAVSFVLCQTLLWLLAGSPPGVEELLYRRLLARFRRVAKA